MKLHDLVFSIFSKHITVFMVPIKIGGEWKIKNEVYVSVLADKEPENASVVAAIIKKNLECYAKANRHVTSAIFRSDNVSNRFRIHFL